MTVTGVATTAASQGAMPVALSPEQTRLLASWTRDSAGLDPVPESMRRVFLDLTEGLAAVSLSDPENGEILGTAIELVDALVALDRQPSSSADRRPGLAVHLVPGAADRLRRAGECANRLPAAGATTVVCRIDANAAPTLTLELSADGTRATVRRD
ncbi:MAG: hypothetical protein R2712_02155 [Vicinamibacterales bacterium]